MTDYNRPSNEAANRTPILHRSPLPTTGPIFERLDFLAGIVAAVMILGPWQWPLFGLRITNRLAGRAAEVSRPVLSKRKAY